MLTIRLTNTPLFCVHDIDEIIEETVSDLSELSSDSETGLLTANELGRIFLSNVENHLAESVNAMRELRGIDT